MPSDLRRLLPLVLVCGLVPCLLLGCGKPDEPTEEESHPAPVEVEPARVEPLGEWTELLGTTQPLPNRAARVSAAVEGHVLAVLGEGVAEGVRVKRGQVIVRLDDRVARANRAKLAAAVAEMEQQKKQAGYAIDLAEIEVKRLEQLRKTTSGGAPLVGRVELDKARIALKEAQSRQQGVAAKEATLEADLEALDAQLQFYTLHAPIDGELGLLQVQPGQTITPGTTVADVVDLGEIDVLCFVPPHTARQLRPDQPARLGPSGSALGRVVFIAVQANAETGNFAVKVRFPNEKRKLRANAVLRVQVLTQPEKKRLVIPEAALQEDQDPPVVVVAQDVETKKDHEGKEEKVGKARKLRAILGVRDRGQGLVELLRLEVPGKPDKVPIQGALFVTKGGHGLVDDDPVKVEDKKAEEKHEEKH